MAQNRTLKILAWYRGKANRKRGESRENLNKKGVRENPENPSVVLREGKQKQGRIHKKHEKRGPGVTLKILAWY